MTSSPSEPEPGATVESAAREIMGTLTARFPVCMASDEFHYFLQARAAQPDWSRWDRFAGDEIEDTVAAIAKWVDTLSSIAAKSPTSATERIEASMLQRVLTTIGEQFTEVGFHKIQPTFYLTVATIGLAEALEAGPEAFYGRISGLPAFLRRAIDNLQCIPSLFRDLGLEMVDAMIEWLSGLRQVHGGTATAIEGLLLLKTHLESVETRERFQPAPELYARIASHHMDCRLPLGEIHAELQREIDETEAMLKREAHRLEPGTTWQQALAEMPRPAGSIRQLYQDQIDALAQHCRAFRMVSEHQLQACPVKIEPIPEALRPVRSAAAYSMPPGHPPRGGTFFISEKAGHSAPPVDYGMLTAHETYPGHHLLDSARWRHHRWVRRHVEFPIFYEGWASFAEEILFDTKFFAGTVDRFLLAKRRYWRAVRGMADLTLNSADGSITAAADFLHARGMSRTQSVAMARRYALKPGYQLAYTIGRRKFHRLYSAFVDREGSPAEFVRRVLAEGQIGLDPLEAILLETHSF